MTNTLGPVEYVVIHFDSDRFDGSIMPALDEVLQQGAVRLLDIALVSRSRRGVVSILETQELAPEISTAFEKVSGQLSPLLTEGDLTELGDALPPGSTAAALLFEHVWATRFGEALRAANGRLVMAERIPNPVIVEAQALLSTPQ